MSGIVPLLGADKEELYGGKAVGLGDALRAGLPVPPGIALPGPAVDAIASGETDATAALRDAVRPLPMPLAVRSSAVDEDSAGASFAGQHITPLYAVEVRCTGDAPRDPFPYAGAGTQAADHRFLVRLFRDCEHLAHRCADRSHEPGHRWRKR